MKEINWPTAADLEPKRLAEARRKFHNAVQWPARVVNSYVAAQPDHDHLRMRWDASTMSLVTNTFFKKLSINTKLPELHLQFLDNGRLVTHVMKLEDRSPAEVEAWILIELLHRGIDRDRFSKALPFALDNPMTGDSEKFIADEYQPELSYLTSWLASAAQVLTGLAPAGKDGGVSLDPESLHLTVAGAKQKPIAFCLGDSKHPEPYFTVAGKSVLTAAKIHKDALSAKAVGDLLSNAASAGS